MRQWFLREPEETPGPSQQRAICDLIAGHHDKTAFLTSDLVAVVGFWITGSPYDVETCGSTGFSQNFLPARRYLFIRGATGMRGIDDARGRVQYGFLAVLELPDKCVDVDEFD